MTSSRYILRRSLAWLPRGYGPQSVVWVAALSLVAIQVSIGIIMKSAQTGGTYSFSPSASIVISEFLKMLLSMAFFYRVCQRRAADGIQPSTRGGGSGYSALLGSELPITDENSSVEKEDTTEVEDLSSSRPRLEARLPYLSLGKYWSYIRGEVTGPVRMGFCNLALFYVLINNSIFVAYKLADPGTIQLIKSGVTLITALVMITFLNTKLSKIQWMAITVQVCGLVVTQYDPEIGATYPLKTYLVLLFQVVLAACSGVYNQALLKSDDSSLHADNMILYAAGAVINLMVHMMLKLFKRDEPGFFEGYNSFGAIMVIVSNVLIGLAITAVYKYADAVVKCLSTAVATGILLYISPILFGTQLKFLVIPGTIVIFTSLLLYMDNPSPSPDAPPQGTGHLWQALRKYSKGVLVISTFLTVLVSVFLTMLASSLNDITPHKSISNGSHVSFQNTFAMVRWNSPHPERIHYIEKYKPFFHTLHFSMPHMIKDQPNFHHNLTHDQFGNSDLIYVQVANTMEIILSESPDINGLFYFHFDAWIDPSGWINQNYDNIWYPSVSANGYFDPSYGPWFICMTDRAEYPWFGWDDVRSWHKKSLEAIAEISSKEFPGDYKRNEFCVGWSDIYFIPRRFFKDFISLSKLFAKFEVMHEAAIPTMLHIIDQSRRESILTPVLDRFGDCWGSCCAENPEIHDVLWARCGHKLDYTNESVTNAFYNKLDEQAKILGTLS